MTSCDVVICRNFDKSLKQPQKSIHCGGKFMKSIYRYIGEFQANKCSTPKIDSLWGKIHKIDILAILGEQIFKFYVFLEIRHKMTSFMTSYDVVICHNFDKSLKQPQNPFIVGGNSGNRYIDILASFRRTNVQILFFPCNPT